MTFEKQLIEAAYREGEAWCLCVYAAWSENGWSMPEQWPFSMRHAIGVLGLPEVLSPAVTRWLAAVVDVGARLGWARLRSSATRVGLRDLRHARATHSQWAAHTRRVRRECDALKEKRP